MSCDARPAKVEALAAREDGRRDLVDLGRGQHEDDVGRRLFEGLQEGVEGLLGEHVDLVDDVHLVAAVDRRVADLVAQLADVVDAAVGGGVHLDHVERRRGGDRPAAFAHAAGRDGRLGDHVLGVGPRAVERLGQDLGHARLAGAARPGEDVGVGDGSATHGVLQGLRDVVLAGDLGEGLRAVLAVEGELHGRPSVPCPARPGEDAGGATRDACAAYQGTDAPRRPVTIAAPPGAPAPRAGKAGLKKDRPRTRRRSASSGRLCRAQAPVRRAHGTWESLFTAASSRT